MELSYLYRASARWTNDRSGMVKAEAVELPLLFSSPPEFKGEARQWTPEHLFVSAVAACFVTTFRAIAEVSKLDLLALDVEADGLLEIADGGYRFTEIVVRPELVIAKESDRDRAERLLEKAEHSCLISRSILAEVRMEPLVTIADGVAA